MHHFGLVHPAQYFFLYLFVLLMFHLELIVFLLHLFLFHLLFHQQYIHLLHNLHLDNNLAHRRNHNYHNHNPRIILPILYPSNR